MEYSEAWGKLIQEENLKSEILCQTSFGLSEVQCSYSDNYSPDMLVRYSDSCYLVR
jgi:hypothetical protein